MSGDIYDVVVVGGGAAGFFAAITCAETRPDTRILILEKGKNYLHKVKISGGGRCNVTHACFDPQELIQYYPRGAKELLGPFHHFAPGDMLDWLAKRGVETKIEADGRIFPSTDDSQTIVDCLYQHAQKSGVELRNRQNIVELYPPTQENYFWHIVTQNGQAYQTRQLLLSTGSNPKIWQLLESLGHTIVSPVPSLFTFNISDDRISDLAGIALPMAQIRIADGSLASEGPLLLTHWGMSGPAILKLSAWGAHELATQAYQFDIQVSWQKNNTTQQVMDTLLTEKRVHSKKQIGNTGVYAIPKRLWHRLLRSSTIDPLTRWADLSKTQLRHLSIQLTAAQFQVAGKSTYKDEFVTAGGVSLKEIDFRYFQSKIYSTLYFAGEILDIDALTGGFNFQAAWTGGYLAGKAIAAVAHS